VLWLWGVHVLSVDVCRLRKARAKPFQQVLCDPGAAGCLECGRLSFSGGEEQMNSSLLFTVYCRHGFSTSNRRSCAVQLPSVQLMGDSLVRLTCAWTMPS